MTLSPGLEPVTWIEGTRIVRELSRFRYRIDTVFSQLSGRYSIKRVWARDLWHLTSRLLRKVLSHPWLSCSTIGAATHPCNWRSSSTKTCTSG